MNLSERIKQAQDALLAKKDELKEATEALEAAPDEEALLVQVEELSAQVEGGTKTLEALKSIQEKPPST